MAVTTAIVLGVVALGASLVLTLLGVGVLVHHWRIGRNASHVH
ncbi:hypothetical protein [Zoogloea sp.]|nr:hypothetical protein [Zoogloea sp.]